VPVVDPSVLQRDLAGLRRFLWQELPARRDARSDGGSDAGPHAAHEVAWELGERFDAAGRPEHAALCRSRETHEILAVWRWTRSFPDVPDAFWSPARARLGTRTSPPPKVALSLAGARAVLEAIGDGLPLTPRGTLPLETVLALDDRFRWTEEFPWLRPGAEADIPPLRFLHEHLLAQALLASDGRRVSLTEHGRSVAGDPARLWHAVVDPAPRWTREFERDALGVLAASLLRSGTFTPGRVTEEVAHVVAGKWRPVRARTSAGVYEGVAAVAQGWYQVGVPLGWWDTGRGPADRHPNAFGAAAADAVFRAAPVATARAAAPPG
jgi:hypothetical protein